MKLDAHQMAEARVFEDWLPSSLTFLDRLRRKAAEGRAKQVAYGELVRMNLQHGCVALILGRGDEEALRHFREAVEYGMALLEAPSGKGPRIYEMQVNVSERGSELAAMHEKPPQRGSELLAVTDFSPLLMATIAFGSNAQRVTVAGYPEERYSNPEIVAPPHVYGHVRALKAWLRGEEVVARREAEKVVETCSEVGPRAGMAAFLALVTRDQPGFEKYLEERLKAHKKQYEKSASDPMGFVSMHGLALCRLALERGMRVEEWPYLPVRLLPNYQPAMH